MGSPRMVPMAMNRYHPGQTDQSRLYNAILDAWDVQKFSHLPADEARQLALRAVSDLKLLPPLAMDPTQVESLREQIVDEILSLGPLQRLMKDTMISDILVDRKSTRLNSSHIPLSRMP